MTKIFNDPADFAEESLAGFLSVHAQRVRGVVGGAVVRGTRVPQVAVVVGGGAGHYPESVGFLGEGFATGAVVGNVFTSPSTAHVYSVAKAANQGLGVVLAIGNYAGDCMNFSLAAERLRAEGIDTRLVIVTDDIASSALVSERRGVAGSFAVYKALGAAATAGASIDEVERMGNAANAAIRTLGVAYSGCTLPGADGPLFVVPAGMLGRGLGIHGEPGIRDEPLGTARELAQLLVAAVLDDAPEGAGTRVAPILNGLGTTKYEELFVLWNEIAILLAEAGVECVEPEVGELVTSLDMGGCSLSLLWLDDELEELWRADAYTVSFRKFRAATAQLSSPTGGTDAGPGADSAGAPPSTAAARSLATIVVAGFDAMLNTVEAQGERWGAIDAVAGDGDHGRGMRRGIAAARAAAHEAFAANAGAGWVLRQAGAAWAREAGGTSGVLWGAALEASGVAVGDDRELYEPADAATAAEAFLAAITQLGGATVGDKTIVDALEPFVVSLREAVAEGVSLGQAWNRAAEVALWSADATAPLSPRLGRARPLAGRSIGTPDAGATSFAEIVRDLGVRS